ncbi:Fic family protein [Alteromonas confluentis]|uniref:Protein adenylyltransferase n=1 Tax=Alteromonas confluentis TaxID=1656094 RepID=A0A1E7ZBE2_9ALTE|nr:Fic family protein [Alteromonas confluentis]OFC70828.1 addiction module protein [Alteromonas confluentis]
MEKLLAPLPPQIDLETPSVLKALIAAHRHLAELKGVAKTIPNEGMLISTLALQEAQSSSAIENIITTQDQLYKYQLHSDKVDPVTKEVAFYAQALHLGYKEVVKVEALTLNTIIEMQEVLEGNRAGLRKTPGTILKNELTGEVVFQPPSPDRLLAYMTGLEQFINHEQSLDPLVCMALIHHQFETIHPFYDGNGRTGRIINILYLVLSGLLDTPILYLSRYINHTKDQYYSLLQTVRDTNEWEAWILYILKAVSVTAKHTTAVVEAIGDLLIEQKQHIRTNHKFYSQDLMNSLFSHPYTKVAFIEEALGVSRATATRYLDALCNGTLSKHRLGRESYYVNDALVALLFELPPIE